ncbi:MAG: heavy-metal-associated domain-containing protein [Deferribacteres bacterium]|nr:heavy-metal-associated domain-containing protein [Deferribacteres bacterium]
MFRKSLIVLAAFLLILAGTAVCVNAAERSVVMDIEGMSTELCPIAVKKSLTQIKGVRDVEVSRKDNKARVIVDDSVAEKTLIEAVEKAGVQGKNRGKETTLRITVSGFQDMWKKFS